MNAVSHIDAPAGAAPDALPAILLVEDEPTARLMTARQLKRAGYDVESVGNGVEALARLKERFFPLLLTDWEMPEMDGLALCRAVRETELEGYVFTILLTARDGKACIIEGLQAGADDYLTKPVDDSELMARLSTGRRILKLERSLRAANRENLLLSITDALTGTYNRRHLMEQLPKEIERARQLLVGGEQPAQLDECAHHVDAHRHGARGVQNVGGLDGAVLGESVRQVLDVLAAGGLQDHSL